MKQSHLFAYASIGSLVLGTIVALLHFDVLRIDVCILPSRTTLLGFAHNATHKPVTLFYWHHERFDTSTMSIVWQTHNIAQTIQTVTRHWLVLHQEANQPHYPARLEWAALSASGHEVCLEFSHSFLSPDWSMRHKWAVIESLNRTLQSLALPLQQVWILVQGKPLDDQHIACIQPYALMPLLHDTSSTTTQGTV